MPKNPIFTNFITVIGSYKNKSLNSWTNILFADVNQQNYVMTQLGEIRRRYADARNNLICHINDELQSSSVSIPTQQISDDVKILRDIFNMIRRNYNIPIVVSISEPRDCSSVKGLNKIFSILSSEIKTSD